MSTLPSVCYLSLSPPRSRLARLLAAQGEIACLCLEASVSIWRQQYAALTAPTKPVSLSPDQWEAAESQKQRAVYAGGPATALFCLSDSCVSLVELFYRQR